MNQILNDNEIAFSKRYKMSLEMLWNRVNIDEKNYLVSTVALKNDCQINDAISSFESKCILRIVLGYGGRLLLDGIMDNSMPALRTIIWEPDSALFCAFCSCENISDYISDERLSFVIGDDLEYLERVLRENIHDNNAYHYNAIAFGKYSSSNNEYISNLLMILERVVRDATQGGYERKSLNEMACINLLHTIKSLSNNFVISQLFNAIPMRTVPIIIVSAGPSLMKNCNELIKAKNKAIIIAVSHSMKTLDRIGLEPDFVAVYDASETDFLINDKIRDNIILSSVYADYKCRKDYDGHIVFYGFSMIDHLFVCDRILTEQHVEIDTSSVATDVFSLFIEAGFKTIILCGQDLAYAENGLTHTEGECENSSYEENNLYSETDGIFGDKVRTREDWERFKKQFEIKISEQADVDVIDATEGGALIHGTKIMTLSEAIEKYCKLDYPIRYWTNSMMRGDREEKKYIEQWFTDNTINLLRVADCIDEAISLNKSIRLLWNYPDKWDADFSADCKRYDIMYSQIMEGSKGELLRLYCIERVQKYVEDALTYEGDNNTEKRMIMEYKLFSELKDKAVELKKYIDELMDFDDCQNCIQKN